jgi:hypothetical protein
MYRNKLLMAVATALTIVSSLAAAGPVTGGAWSWASGKITNNGSVQLKSANGTATYNAVQNPTGVMVKSNQSALTQPPLVIVQKSSLPCYLGMSKEDRKTGCVFGADVFSDPEGRNKVGKYGGYLPIQWTKGSGSTRTTGTFLQDFIVALNDISAKYGCFSEGYEPVPAKGAYDMRSVMYILGYNRPTEVADSAYEVIGLDWGLALSSDFMYSYVNQGKCSASGRTNAAIIQCSASGKGWYVPALNELSFLYQNRTTFGGFSNERYWSAQSSGNDQVSYVFDFSTGTSTFGYRTEVHRVRCLRVFNDLIR